MPLPSYKSHLFFIEVMTKVKNKRHNSWQDILSQPPVEEDNGKTTNPF